MGNKREDVDLDLVLNNPRCARQYIADFNWNTQSRPKYITINLNEEIWLDNMSDLEAVTAAKAILRSIEIPQAVNQMNSGTVDVH